MGAMLEALDRKKIESSPWLALLLAAGLHGALYVSGPTLERARAADAQEAERKPTALDQVLVDWESPATGEPKHLLSIKPATAAPLTPRGPAPQPAAAPADRVSAAALPSKAALPSEAPPPSAPPEIVASVSSLSVAMPTSTAIPTSAAMPFNDVDNPSVAAHGARVKPSRGEAKRLGAGGLVGGSLGAGSLTRRPARPQLLVKSHQCADLFPYDATQNRGAVTVRLHVNMRGRATQVHLGSEDMRSEFAEAARLCARRLRFQPALDQRGSPMEGNATLRLHFERQTFLRGA